MQNGNLTDIKMRNNIEFYLLNKTLVILYLLMLILDETNIYAANYEDTEYYLYINRIRQTTLGLQALLCGSFLILIIDGSFTQTAYPIYGIIPGVFYLRKNWRI